MTMKNNPSIEEETWLGYQGSLVQSQESNGPRLNSTEDDMERNINSTVTAVPKQINLKLILKAPITSV